MLSAHLHWGWKALDPRKDVGESLGRSALRPGSALLQQRLARAARKCRHLPSGGDGIPLWATVDTAQGFQS